MGMNLSPPRTIRGVLIGFLVVAVLLLGLYVSPMAWLVGALILVVLVAVLYALGFRVFNWLAGVV